MGSQASQYMTLVPGYTLYAPWTLLTSAFVEVNIWEVSDAIQVSQSSANSKLVQLAMTLIFVPAALKYLERLWGGIETIKFIVVSIVASNIIAFGFNWIEFIATRNADLFL